MNGLNGPLSFVADIDASQWNRILDQMERRVLGLTSTTVRETSRIDDSFRRLGQLAVGAFAFSGLSDLPQQIVKVWGEFEALSISLTTILRSREKADALLQNVTKFAGESPFGLKDAANGAKQLLAYGFAAEETVPILRKLSDIATGLGLPLERLTYLYGSAKVSGRLYAEDLNQWLSSNVPLIKTLADQFGVAEERVKGLVTEGKVGFKEVEKAITSLTTGAGMFAGLTEAQSKSINAMKERLGDAYERMLNDIGQQNQGLIAGVINATTEAVEHYQDFLNILKVVAGAFGVYKAATVLASIAQTGNIAITAAQAIAQAQAANATGFLTISQTKAAASTALLSQAQATLNSVMRINPIVLIGTAIAALTTAFFVYREEIAEVKTAEELMAASSKTASDSFATQRTEITTLVSTIKNQNIAESERLKAYNKLKEIAPDIIGDLDFQKTKTADLTKELNNYLDSLRQKIRLESGQDDLKAAYKQEFDAIKAKEQAQKDLLKVIDEADKRQKKQGTRQINPDGSGIASSVADAQKIANARQKLDSFVARENQAKAEREKVELAYGKTVGSNTLDVLKARRAEQQAILETAGTHSLAYKNAEDEAKRLDEQIKKLTKSRQADSKVALLSIDELNAKIKDLEEKKGKQNSRPEVAKIDNEIKALEAQKRRLMGEKTKEEIRLAKKAQKEAEKSGPLGSLDYYEAVIEKIDAALGKLVPGKDDGKITEQLSRRVNAESQAEAIRKRYAVKSFEDELSEKERLYTVYQNYLTAYGKETADQQFKDLIKNGASYLEYLNTQIANLEDQRSNAGLSDKEAGNLTSLIDQRNAFTNTKTPLDKYVDGLRQAQVESVSLGDYLTKLKAKQDELNQSSPLSTDYFKKQEAVATEIVQTEQQLRDLTNQFLQNATSSGQQELAIKQKYNDLKLGLDKKYNNETTADYYQALAAINTQEQEEFEQFKQRKLEESQAYKELTKVILEEGRKALKIEIDRQKAVTALAFTNFGADSEVYKRQLKRLNELNKALDNDTLTMISQITNGVGQLGQSLSQLGGTAGVVGTIMAGVSGSFNTFSKALNGTATKADLASAGLEAVNTLINIVVSATAQRKQAEESFYNSAIAKQQQYNLLLNEQIGLQTQLKENVFLTDYQGRVGDSYYQLYDAQVKRLEAINSLMKGQAKVGQKNAADMNAVGKGVLSGGLVGGLISLFGAKKREDVFAPLLEVYPKLVTSAGELNLELAESLVKTDQLDDKTRLLLESAIDWQKQVEKARESIKAVVKDLAGQLGNDLRNSLTEAFKTGEDAAMAFRDTVANVIENIVTQLLFAKVFNKTFDQLGKDFEASLNPNGGDGKFDDDIARFSEKFLKDVPIYFEGLEGLKEVFKKAGFDILQNPNIKKEGNSLTGNFQAMQESTANVLVGQFNAIRITTADTNTQIRQQLLVLNDISSNTYHIRRTNELLVSLDSRLKSMGGDAMRGVGLPG